MKRGGSNLSKLVNVDNLLILVAVVLVCVSVVVYLKNHKEHFFSRWYGKKKAIKSFKRGYCEYSSCDEVLNTYKSDLINFLTNYIDKPSLINLRANIIELITSQASQHGFTSDGELGCKNEWANIYNYLKTVGLWTNKYKNVFRNDLFADLYERGRKRKCNVDVEL